MSQESAELERGARIGSRELRGAHSPGSPRTDRLLGSSKTEVVDGEGNPAQGTSGSQKTASNLDDLSIVSRTFLLLAAFRDDFILGVSDLSRRTGLPRTTVHRLANQMVEVGALGRVGTKFRVGATLFELGNLHYPQALRDTLQPVLDDLQRSTGGNVSLLELVGSDVIVIAASRPRRSRCAIAHLGLRFPAHACAGGQVMLAYDERFATGPFRKLTANTIVDEKKINRRLADVRRAGLSIEHGEAQFGWSGIAIPTMNQHGRVLGAIMLTRPTEGFDVDLLVSTLKTFGNTFKAAGRQAAIGFFAEALPRVTHG
jgi:DNA-binding IclR family transcriptional regulator